MSTKILTTQPQSIKAWFLAIRPKTLMAAVAPIIVGTLISNIPFAEMDWKIACSALIAAIMVTISTNLINDALDYKKGADSKERIGPTRVTQSGLLSSTQVLAGGFAFLFLAFLFAIPLILKGGLILFVLAIMSAICSYLYTGGPYPLSYTGLGEVFVIIFYGFVATLTSYYLQTGVITIDSFIAAMQMGSLATVMIAINNLRDIHEDSKTGKKTLAARFGLNFAKWETTFFIAFPFVLNFYWYFTDRFLTFYLPLTSLLIGINLIRQIWKHAPSRLYNRFFGEASLLIIVFGTLLILGMRLG